MKKKVIFLMLVCLQPFVMTAESMFVVDDDKNAISTETVQRQIRDELKTIREIQEDVSNKRKQAVRERHRLDSMENKMPKHDMSTDFSVMSQIEDNTRQDLWKDGWNLYGILAFIVAIASMGVSICTYIAQRRTENNTKKLSQDAQRRLLNELLRHLYRNFVITYTMRTKMTDINYAGHPSEEHFEKLKIPMENIHLDVFYGEDEKFRRMHILYLNLRNYNKEIDVAMQHICSPTLRREIKEEDFKTLEFKVSYLTIKIVNTIKRIWGANEQYQNDMKEAMNLSFSGETNATDNIYVSGCDKFTPLNIKDLEFYSAIYNENEMKMICDTINRDITEERKKNKRGAWKVRMIEY